MTGKPSRSPDQLRRDIKDHVKEMESVQYKIAEALDELLLHGALQLSKRNPGKKVLAISVNGDWQVVVDGDERTPPVLKTFDKMYDDHGYHVIPVVRHDVLDGKVTTNR